ncbi:MAG: TAXI family TRAP transporter solute-binding subunit [Verrucomicrobia bacterium]|nr:TAXI family TRAP transporter solute-binding subunit [Verrucomicrobiota bacterium]
MNVFWKVVLLLFSIAMLVLPASANPVFASIGTGQLNGIYYPVGRAICELANQRTGVDRVFCSAEVTPGSLYNLEAIQSGELEFGIVQSDAAFAAYNGKGDWADKPATNLRSVFGLYSEVFTIVVRGDSGIRELTDLAGKRLNVGKGGSGVRGTWETIETELGWDEAHRARLIELPADVSARALCRGEVDANLLVVGHPSDQVRTQLSACNASLLAITGPIVDKLFKNAPYYYFSEIPAELYGLRSAVPSFGVRAVLMTSATMDPRVVAVVAKAIIAHLSEFQSMHPALSRLTIDGMINSGFPAPLHPAAIEAYQELGSLR